MPAAGASSCREGLPGGRRKHRPYQKYPRATDLRSYRKSNGALAVVPAVAGLFLAAKQQRFQLVDFVVVE